MGELFEEVDLVRECVVAPQEKAGKQEKLKKTTYFIRFSDVGIFLVFLRFAARGCPP